MATSDNPAARRLPRSMALIVALLCWTLSAPLVVSAVTPSGEKDKKKKPEEALISGSVFSEEGLALPGASIRIRHKDHKNPKWETKTDSRGEFAVRLPRSSGDYVLTVSAKSYEEDSREFTITIAEKLNYYFRLRHPEQPETNQKQEDDQLYEEEIK